MRYWFVALCLCALEAAEGRAQHLTEDLRFQTAAGSLAGRMDWTEYVLVVYGSSSPPDEEDPVRRRLVGFRRAIDQARANLRLALEQLYIDGPVRAESLISESPQLQTYFDELASGARVASGTLTDADSLLHIGLEVPLRGAFADWVLPQRGPGPDQLLPEESDSLLLELPDRPYTGVLIDARGIHLKGSLAPRLVSSDGRVLYSLGFADRSCAVDSGLVGYWRGQLEQAAASPRLGGRRGNPLRLRALGAGGEAGTDLVLADEDAVRLHREDAVGGFLNTCGVAVSLGPMSVEFDLSYFDSLYYQPALFAERAYADSLQWVQGWEASLDSLRLTLVERLVFAGEPMDSVEQVLRGFLLVQEDRRDPLRLALIDSLRLAPEAVDSLATDSLQIMSGATDTLQGPGSSANTPQGLIVADTLVIDSLRQPGIVSVLPVDSLATAMRLATMPRLDLLKFLSLQEEALDSLYFELIDTTQTERGGGGDIPGQTGTDDTAQ
ncbi:MAG: hypothetical protein GKR89_11650 [Candidatus Latescibacteria bacterium]|nr:hypothetical protein [Candidatus Latescibacterota bacterium]